MARITLELRRSHVAGEGYVAHLIVGDERIHIDRVLPDWMAADDLHSKLAAEFAKCNVNLIEDIDDIQ